MSDPSRIPCVYARLDAHTHMGEVAATSAATWHLGSLWIQHTEAVLLSGSGIPVASATPADASWLGESAMRIGAYVANMGAGGAELLGGGNGAAATATARGTKREAPCPQSTQPLLEPSLHARPAKLRRVTAAGDAEPHNVFSP